MSYIKGTQKFSLNIFRLANQPSNEHAKKLNFSGNSFVFLKTLTLPKLCYVFDHLAKVCVPHHKNFCKKQRTVMAFLVPNIPIPNWQAYSFEGALFPALFMEVRQDFGESKSFRLDVRSLRPKLAQQRLGTSPQVLRLQIDQEIKTANSSYAAYCFFKVQK